MMAVGLPVIATDAERLKQVVEGVGVLFPVGDEVALSEIIKDIIDDKTKYARMSRTSKERAQRYDISLLIREYSDAYKQICNETFYC